MAWFHTIEDMEPVYSNLQDLRALLPPPDKDKHKDSQSVQKDQAAGQAEGRAGDESEEDPTKDMDMPSITPKKV